jgi:hypothetical protein
MAVPNIRALSRATDSSFPFLPPSKNLAALYPSIADKREKRLSNKGHESATKPALNGSKTFPGEKSTGQKWGIKGAHSISWCRFLCTIMSWTLFIVLSRRLVSVALVKCT